MKTIRLRNRKCTAPAPTSTPTLTPTLCILMDCTVLTAKGNNFLSRVAAFGQTNGGFSHDSEYDLAAMVGDFLENNGGSYGAESLSSSDSDSGFSDLAQLAETISLHKRMFDHYERDLQSVVHSLILSINDQDLQYVKSGQCNASCVRYLLAKLLRRSGYNAAVCSSRWQGSGRVPGGDHEYIDVVKHASAGSSDRLIIDIDFRSHFEIARAVDSYDRLLNLLPVIYVGSVARLNKFLQVMAEAGRFSLKQNSMPIPPWRSLAYLQAKWHSPCQRGLELNDQKIDSKIVTDHRQCRGHLKRLQSALQSEMDLERLLKPANSSHNRMLKFERHWHSLKRHF